MFLAVLFAMLWASEKDNLKYRDSFTKCVEADYQGTGLKAKVDDRAKVFSKDQPVIAVLAPLAYTTIGQKRAQFTSNKASIPGTTTTYRIDQHQGSISVTFGL